MIHLSMWNCCKQAWYGKPSSHCPGVATDVVRVGPGAALNELGMFAGTVCTTLYECSRFMPVHPGRPASTYRDAPGYTQWQCELGFTRSQQLKPDILFHLLTISLTLYTQRQDNAHLIYHFSSSSIPMVAKCTGPKQSPALRIEPFWIQTSCS